MAKIFIIGGMGYLGSYLNQKALALGHEVMLYDSLIYEQMTRPENLIIGDTRNISLLEKCLTHFKPDFVVHFGEFSGVYACNHNPELTEEVNFKASMAVMELCKKMGIKVLYNSTSSVYGVQSTDRLATENDDLPEPTDLYVRYKLRMESALLLRFDNVIVFRPATVFGIAPRMRIDLLPNTFVYMALQGAIKIFDPESFRSFIDVEELTNGYLSVIDRGAWKYRFYNIGQFNLRKRELAEEIKKSIGILCDIQPKFDTDKRNLKINCARFNDEFGFNPTKPLSKSIVEISAKMIKNGVKLEGNNILDMLTMPVIEWKKMCQ